MNNKIFNLNSDNFNQIIKKYNNYYILIFFFTTWCLPCKKMYPIFKKLNNENLLDNLIFCSINIDNNSILIDKYVIKSIPTFIILYSNKIIERKIGFLNFLEFKNFINNSIINFNN